MQQTSPCASPFYSRTPSPILDFAAYEPGDVDSQPRSGTPDPEAALRAKIEQLQAANRELMVRNQCLELKSLKHKKKKNELKLANADLKEQIEGLRLLLEMDNRVEKLNEEDSEFAKDLCSSFVLLQSLTEVPSAPSASFPPPVFELKIVQDYSPSPSVTGFTTSILRQGRQLKPYFRQYVWLREPTEIQKGAIGWAKGQIKLVNDSLMLLAEMRQKVALYKADPFILLRPMNEILDDIKKVNAGLLEDDEDDEETLVPKTAAEDSLLQSVFLPDKMRSVSDTEGLIDRLEVLCHEKHLQLGRTLEYLNNLLQVRIENKQAAAKAHRKAVKKQAKEERMRLEAQKEAAIKLISDRVESIQIARDTLWNVLGDVEKGRVTYELGQRRLKWDTDPVRNLADVCKEFFVRLYIGKLQAHPDYASKIQQFHADLEDGFLKDK